MKLNLDELEVKENGNLLVADVIATVLRKDAELANPNLVNRLPPVIPPPPFPTPIKPTPIASAVCS